MLLSGGRVHDPESWDDCCSQASELLGIQIPQTVTGLLGLLDPLGTKMMAKIVQAIKIQE